MALRKALQWIYLSVGLMIILCIVLIIVFPSNYWCPKRNVRALFATDFIAGERQALLALDSFSQQINQQLNLSRHTLIIRSAAFISRIITDIDPNGRKREHGTMACEVNVSKEKQLTRKGDMLIVDFDLDERLAAMQLMGIVSKIESALTSTTFALTIPVDDDATRSMTTSFCSLILSSSIETRATSCTDRTKNEDETDTDCGGRTCSRKCELNQSCSTNTDCFNGNCHLFLKTCQAPSCTDGNKNQDEIDVDCGGASCSTSCALTQACLSNKDCLNGHCDTASKRCLDP